MTTYVDGLTPSSPDTSEGLSDEQKSNIHEIATLMHEFLENHNPQRDITTELANISNISPAELTALQTEKLHTALDALQKLDRTTREEENAALVHNFNGSVEALALATETEVNLLAEEVSPTAESTNQTTEETIPETTPDRQSPQSAQPSHNIKTAIMTWVATQTEQLSQTTNWAGRRALNLIEKITTHHFDEIASPEEETNNTNTTQEAPHRDDYAAGRPGTFSFWGASISHQFGRIKGNINVKQKFNRFALSTLLIFAPAEVKTFWDRTQNILDNPEEYQDTIQTITDNVGQHLNIETNSFQNETTNETLTNRGKTYFRNRIVARLHHFLIQSNNPDYQNEGDIDNLIDEFLTEPSISSHINESRAGEIENLLGPLDPNETPISRIFEAVGLGSAHTLHFLFFLVDKKVITLRSLVTFAWNEGEDTFIELRVAGQQAISSIKPLALGHITIQELRTFLTEHISLIDDQQLQQQILSHMGPDLVNHILFKQGTLYKRMSKLALGTLTAIGTLLTPDAIGAQASAITSAAGNMHAIGRQLESLYTLLPPKGQNTTIDNIRKNIESIVEGRMITEAFMQSEGSSSSSFSSSFRTSLDEVAAKRQSNGFNPPHPQHLFDHVKSIKIKNNSPSWKSAVEATLLDNSIEGSVFGRREGLGRILEWSSSHIRTDPAHVATRSTALRTTMLTTMADVVKNKGVASRTFPVGKLISRLNLMKQSTRVQELKDRMIFIRTPEDLTELTDLARNVPKVYADILSNITTGSIQLFFAKEMLNNNVQANVLAGKSLKESFVGGVGETLLELTSFFGSIHLAWESYKEGNFVSAGAGVVVAVIEGNIIRRAARVAFSSKSKEKAFTILAKELQIFGQVFSVSGEVVNLVGVGGRTASGIANVAANVTTGGTAQRGRAGKATSLIATGLGITISAILLAREIRNARKFQRLATLPRDNPDQLHSVLQGPQGRITFSNSEKEIVTSLLITHALTTSGNNDILQNIWETVENNISIQFTGGDPSNISLINLQKILQHLPPGTNISSEQIAQLSQQLQWLEEDFGNQSDTPIEITT